MPTELGRPYPVAWRGDPEQMLEQDVPLWHQFLEKYGSQFAHFFYNVRVGGPDVSKINEDIKTAMLWYALNAKRIDAIGEKIDRIWIIEVTAVPGLRAVGQCLSYKYLWEEDPKINKPAIMVLLCQRIDADLEAVLKHYAVKVIKMEKPPE